MTAIPNGWALCDGSNGTPDLRGRFLQGWGNDGHYTRTVGQYVIEGLPNITGGGWAETCHGADINRLWGAFKGLYNNEGDAGGGDGGWAFDFNASRCSSIYGQSTTVQPRAYVVCYIIKIA